MTMVGWSSDTEVTGFALSESTVAYEEVWQGQCHDDSSVWAIKLGLLPNSAPEVLV